MLFYYKFIHSFFNQSTSILTILNTVTLGIVTFDTALFDTVLGLQM